MTDPKFETRAELEPCPVCHAERKPIPSDASDGEIYSLLSFGGCVKCRDIFVRPFRETIRRVTLAHQHLENDDG